MVNSSEAELKRRVNGKFKKLKSLEQGGTTYLKFMLDEMFCMSNGFVAALQTFLKSFSEEDLSKTVRENVSEILAQVKAVRERLTGVNQIPLEDPTYILQGLNKCSVDEFTGPFELLLKWPRKLSDRSLSNYLKDLSRSFYR